MIVSFGSLNHDLAIHVPRHPTPDETLLASSTEHFRGGKGHNQALAAARLGAPVAMAGCVGDDQPGRWLREGLVEAGADVNHVETALQGTVSTGTAYCFLDATGEVAIVVVPGANGIVDPAMAERAAPLLERATVLLLQGEVDPAASCRAAELAHAAGARVIVNPAPVPADPKALLDVADVLVVNQPEAEQLGLAPSERVVLTRGAAGVRVADVEIPAFPAQPVDPTGAGDAFVGGLAVALHEGGSLVEAARLGAACGACAVEVAGAGPSFPTRAQAEAKVAGASGD